MPNLRSKSSAVSLDRQNHPAEARGILYLKPYSSALGNFRRRGCVHSGMTHTGRSRPASFWNWRSRRRSKSASCARGAISVKLQATVPCVKIRNFVHKGLKRLYEEDSARGVALGTGDKLRKMFAYLDNMEDPEELRALSSWRAHTLTGDRKGTWSLSVTANRRLTFRIDTDDREICDVDLEDYH